MIKIEREILSKKITAMTKCHKYLWQMLKEQIAYYGYQDYYPAQDFFTKPVDFLVATLDESEKKILIDAWKKELQRAQFETDEEYLSQYKLFVMEELVNRATKAAYR
ncbi:MAG: hypothetical protein QG567_2425 [Campylobacterota bacterium]|nr:hypothetical protein [Campylobacterota bacterium]MDQ1341267.1 hypothetical protein [Campylobacterota bacterium]